MCILFHCTGDTSGYRYEVQAKDLLPGLVEAGIARLPKPQLPVEVPLSPPTQAVDTVRDGKQSPPPLPCEQAAQSCGCLPCVR